MKIKDYSEGRLYCFFTVLSGDNEYTLTMNKETRFWTCSCFHGANMGVNNKQVCKHKTLCMEFIENGK